ncbi:uncharacterized protein LOC110726010 [Chenopodium quinoa]|uniref:uncharacterized protein LOC110726010 n=1 Tax=Chenopodium quinoa TaxID=63459 RepID=UPI000B78EF12|nr:uncharacterized protein LOC110726010 [Chenopodium quinoa]
MIKYAKEILESAGIANCNSSPTPVNSKGEMRTDSGDLYADPTMYRRLCGALQYLTFTRPEISYAVQQVCLFMHSPRVAHMDAMKHILRYIQGNHVQHQRTKHIELDIHFVREKVQRGEGQS